MRVVEPGMFRHLFAPRVCDSNKGMYGHVLVIAGARGKTGAAAMAGIAALRAGAGLSTVASAESALAAIASFAPEIMTAPLPETEAGSIALRSFDHGLLASVLERKTAAAIGPGLGTHPETVQFIRRAADEIQIPMILDADALNALAHKDLHANAPRILTPHPGEMSRLTGRTVQQIQHDRVDAARCFARERGVCVVLKGHRTVTAFADGRVFINPTTSPALATGGAGDVLTGLIAGFVAQFPEQLEMAVLAAVYLHGRCGELGASKMGEKAFIATDIFEFLPQAMSEAAEGYNPALV